MPRVMFTREDVRGGRNLPRGKFTDGALIGGSNLPRGKFHGKAVVGGSNLPRGKLRVSRGGNRAQHRRNIRPWEALSEHPLDLGLGLIFRSRQQLGGNLGTQMRRKQTCPGQMQTTLRHRGEDIREVARGTRGLDALVGRVFGQPQFAHAVGMHGRIAGRYIEPACIEFGDVGQQACRGRAFLGGGRFQIAGKGSITEMLQ